jgi:hypothetical protein
MICPRGEARTVGAAAGGAGEVILTNPRYIAATAVGSPT